MCLEYGRCWIYLSLSPFVFSGLYWFGRIVVAGLIPVFIILMPAAFEMKQIDECFSSLTSHQDQDLPWSCKSVID